MIEDDENNRTISEEASEAMNVTAEKLTDNISYSWSDVYIPGQNRTFGRNLTNETDVNDDWNDLYEWE